MADKLAQIQKRIFIIRETRVMLDSDLAYLYEVEAKRLNEAVKRNIKRFPEDFMFQLTKDEFAEVVANCDHLQNLKFRPTLPYAFTEQGVSMLSSVINSERAIEVNINIMRAFVKLRHYVFTKSDTNEQIAELRKMLMIHMENTDFKLSKQNKTIEQIIIALNNLIEQPPKTKRIGFNTDN
ncbi:MAG: ORF6N domain-containing protein [Treponema sp.]|jgi:hypothetical protein|nr:ORF6N domain-containing protein [Treponema sp.]